MHPIISEQHARMVMEERHREAALRRRARHVRRPSLRVRAGGLLIAAGQLLQRASRSDRRRAAQPCAPTPV